MDGIGAVAKAADRLLAASRANLRAMDWGLVVLAVLTVSLQIAFAASWIIAGALQPHYSAIVSTYSELGATDAAHPWILNGGVLLWAASFLPLSVAVRRALPPGQWRTRAVWTFLALGLILVVVGLARMDCMPTVSRACYARQQAELLSWHHYVHLWSSVAFDVLVSLTPIPIWRALPPGLPRRLAFGCSIVGVAIALTYFIGAFSFSSQRSGDAGLIERIGFGSFLAWTLLLFAVLLLTSLVTRARSAAAG